MPTYVYETIGKGNEVCQFEIRQSMHDAPLKKHPETGEPLRRVISGGIGFLKVRSGGNTTQPHSQTCCPGCHD